MFVEDNPHRIATKTDFFKADGSGSISTRLKMAKTGNIIAAFVDLNGKIIATQKEVQITVGSVGDGENTVGGSAEGEAYTCENVYSPNYRDLEDCKAKLGDEALPSSIAKIRAKTDGETTSLKMLMSQPMEPKDHITSVSVIADNALHSKTFFTPYVSKNPYLANKFPIPTQKLKIKFEATNSRLAEMEEFELSTSGAFKPSTSKPEAEAEAENPTTPESADQTALATSKGCMASHKVDIKVVGPSFKDVAARYEGDAGALETLIIKVRDGGQGNWGEIPMPPNAAVSDEDLNTLVTWILGLAGKPWWDPFTS